MRECSQQLETELTTLTTERDQLRAALALGQQNCDDAYDDLRAERAAAIARAESAEREAFDWKKIARYEAARAERAEAELASERARLADLVADLSDACITLESAENDCDDYAMQSTAFKLMAVRNVFAAMKEASK